MDNIKLPDGWQYIKISDLTDVITGGTPSTNKSEYWDGGDIPWLPSGDCKDSVINSATKFITEEGLKNSAAKLMPINTVVIALTGATTGKVGILNIEASANQSVTGIVPNEKFVPKYIFYYLRSIREKILNDSYGGAQKHISQGYVKDIQVLLPSLNTQKKIVAILERAENALEKRKEVIKLLDELVKSRFIEMFGNPEHNPNKYDIVPFDKIIKYIGDIGSNGANATISANLKMTDTEDYALMVRTLNFTSNDFKNNVKYVSKEVYEFFKKSQIFGGELIFNKIGSAGINFIMPNLNRPVSLGLNQIMVRTNEKVNMIYLHTLLNTEYGKHQINRRIQGAVTKSITKGAIKEMPILLPPIKRQNQFAAFVNQVDKLKFEMEESLKGLENNFSSLMQRAFKGELFS